MRFQQVGFSNCQYTHLFCSKNSFQLLVLEEAAADEHYGMYSVLSNFEKAIHANTPV